MTPQEIIEGDKILAVFMEGYYNEKHDCITWGTVEKSPNKYETWISVENLKYHSSWDWLMPVCIKLGMVLVSTVIILTYKTVINEIEKLETSKRL